MIRTLALSATLAVCGVAFAQDADHDAHDHAEHAHAGEDHAGHTPETTPTTDEIDLETMPETIRAAVSAGGELTIVNVRGLVCDFCAEAMTRTFGRHEEVTGVHVDLDTKQLRLVTHPGVPLDDETIDDLVRRSGYELSEIRRVGS